MVTNVHDPLPEGRSLRPRIVRPLTVFRPVGPARSAPGGSRGRGRCVAWERLPCSAAGSQVRRPPGWGRSGGQGAHGLAPVAAAAAVRAGACAAAGRAPSPAGTGGSGQAPAKGDRAIDPAGPGRPGTGGGGETGCAGAGRAIAPARRARVVRAAEGEATPPRRTASRGGVARLPAVVVAQVEYRRGDADPGAADDMVVDAVGVQRHAVTRVPIPAPLNPANPTGYNRAIPHRHCPAGETTA